MGEVTIGLGGAQAPPVFLRLQQNFQISPPSFKPKSKLCIQLYCTSTYLHALTCTSTYMHAYYCTIIVFSTLYTSTPVCTNTVDLYVLVLYSDSTE